MELGADSLSASEKKIDPLGDLRERFRNESRAELSMIEGFTTGESSRKKAEQTAHRWIGAGALLGYVELSGLAAELEKLLSTGCDPSDKNVQRLLEGIGRELGETRELGDSEEEEEDEEEEPEASKSDDPKDLASSRVGLMGFDGSDADRLCRAFSQSGASCLRCEVGDGPEALSAFDLLVVRLGPEGGEGAKAKAALAATAARLWVGEDLDAGSWFATLSGPPADFLIEPFGDDPLIIRAEMLLRRQPASAPPVAVEGDSKPHVLLASQDAIITAILEATLVEHGFICSTALNGEETIDICVRESPDAVVLDVVMPDISGIDVIEKLRENPLTQATPVLLLTSRTHEADVMRGSRLGIEDYVVRPFWPTEVLVRLCRLVGVESRSVGV